MFSLALPRPLPHLVDCTKLSKNSFCFQAELYPPRNLSSSTQPADLMPCLPLQGEVRPTQGEEFGGCGCLAGDKESLLFFFLGVTSRQIRRGKKAVNILHLWTKVEMEFSPGPSLWVRALRLGVEGRERKTQLPSRKFEFSETNPSNVGVIKMSLHFGLSLVHVNCSAREARPLCSSSGKVIPQSI